MFSGKVNNINRKDTRYNTNQKELDPPGKTAQILQSLSMGQIRKLALALLQKQTHRMIAVV